jgi:hypothetical protein
VLKHHHTSLPLSRLQESTHATSKSIDKSHTLFTFQALHPIYPPQTQIDGRLWWHIQEYYNKKENVSTIWRSTEYKKKPERSQYKVKPLWKNHMKARFCLNGLIDHYEQACPVLSDWKRCQPILEGESWVSSYRGPSCKVNKKQEAHEWQCSVGHWNLTVTTTEQRTTS